VCTWQGVVLPGAYWSDRAAHGTEEKRQEEKAVLRHSVKARQAHSLARGRVRMRPVGSDRGLRTNARLVLDKWSASRARWIAFGRKSTRKVA
jgi:hypothetical protein